MEFFDEMGLNEDCRAQYRQIQAWLEQTPAELFAVKRREAEVIFRPAS